jgi:type II secretory pathway pseudopilin PulG
MSGLLLKSERGITILETTVILSVLFILAGAMSPIVSESVNTARAVKAKNDASMIALGLINLQKDVGADALNFGGEGVAPSTALGASGTTLRLPDLLASQGSAPDVEDAQTSESDPTPMVPLLAAPGHSGVSLTAEVRAATRAERRRWRDMASGSLDDHLMNNRRGYRIRRVGEYGGWNGPYVSAEVKGDPWGRQFLVNSRWLDGGSSAADAQGRIRRAVFVVSAGADGVIDTPFEQSIVNARAFGDDIVIRIQ